MKQRPFDLAIFDLDGTIVNTISSLAASMNAVLSHYGHSPVPNDRFPAFIGHGSRHLVRRSMEYAGVEVTEELHSLYHEKYLKLFDELCVQDVAVYPGILEFMSALRKAGYYTAVLTNKPHGPAIKVIDTVFPPGLFDEVIGQREGHPRKPDPAEALAICARLGVTPQRSVMVGDGDTDIQTGKNAGMTTVSVGWGYRPSDLLKALEPDCFIEDLSGLYGVLLPPSQA